MGCGHEVSQPSLLPGASVQRGGSLSHTQEDSRGGEERVTPVLWKRNEATPSKETNFALEERPPSWGRGTRHPLLHLPLSLSLTLSISQGFSLCISLFLPPASLPFPLLCLSLPPPPPRPCLPSPWRRRKRGRGMYLQPEGNSFPSVCCVLERRGGGRQATGAPGMGTPWTPWPLLWAVLQLGWRPGWLLGRWGKAGRRGQAWEQALALGLWDWGGDCVAECSVALGKGSALSELTWW